MRLLFTSTLNALFKTLIYNFLSLPDGLQIRRFSGSTFNAEINYLCFSRDGSSVVAAADGDIKVVGVWMGVLGDVGSV